MRRELDSYGERFRANPRDSARAEADSTKATAR
jgi:hypothetical protein